LGSSARSSCQFHACLKYTFLKSGAIAGGRVLPLALLILFQSTLAIQSVTAGALLYRKEEVVPICTPRELMIPFSLYMLLRSLAVSRYSASVAVAVTDA